MLIIHHLARSDMKRRDSVGNDFVPLIARDNDLFRKMGFHSCKCATNDEILPKFTCSDAVNLRPQAIQTFLGPLARKKSNFNVFLNAVYSANSLSGHKINHLLGKKF